MPWYAGPTLLEHLETVEVDDDRGRARRSASRCSMSTAPTSTSAALPAPSRPARSRRATRSSWPSPARPRASSASSRMDGDLGRAVEGQAVTLVLDDEVEVSRGNMLVVADGPPAGRRPVRRQHRLVRRARAAARPLLHPAHRDRPGQRHGHRAEAPHRRQHLRA